jgi:hypothetical protein
MRAIVDLVPREIVRRVGDQFEIGTESAQHVAPEMFATVSIKKVTSRLAEQPCALRNFTLQLPFAPSGVTYKSANRGVFGIHALLRFLETKMMAAFDALRFRVPLEGGKDQLVGADRPAQENRHSRESAEILAGQNIRDGAAGEAIHGETKRTFLGIVGGEKEDRLAKIRIVQTGVGDEQRPGKANGGRAEFAHKRTLEICGEFSTRKRGGDLL